MMMHRLANFKFTQVSISKVCNMLESYNKSVIDYGMDSQCTSLGEDIVGWTVSVQVSERTLWYGQPVYTSQRGHCGMDSQCTSLREDIVVWTASVQSRNGHCNLCLDKRIQSETCIHSTCSSGENVTHKINFAKYNLLQDIQLQIEQLSTVQILDPHRSVQYDIQHSY